MRRCSQAALWLYFRGRVFGMRNVPRTGGVLLACNHQSYFDPIACTCALPREGNYMARDTLFTNPFFGRLISSLNAFPVKRGAADVGAVKEILRRLRAGAVVTVFPEATRTLDGSIGTINANSMAVGKKAGVTIVPTIIDGAFEAWPRGKAFPRPRTMYVTYARAITPAEAAAMSAEEIAEVVNRRLAEGMAASRRMRAIARGGRRSVSR